eukprot:3799283-Ditylum_brightwellii.AAC.1
MVPPPWPAPALVPALAAAHPLVQMGFGSPVTQIPQSQWGFGVVQTQQPEMSTSTSTGFVSGSDDPFTGLDIALTPALDLAPVVSMPDPAPTATIAVNPLAG